MKNLLLILALTFIALGCKKQNYAQFQESKMIDFENHKTRPLNSKIYEDIQSNQITITKQPNLNTIDIQNNVKITKTMVLRRNSIKLLSKQSLKTKFVSLNKVLLSDSNTIKTDTLKRKINYDNMAALSGYALGGSLLFFILGNVLGISIIISLTSLLFLTSLVLAFVSVKKAKKSVRIWPILTITIFSLMLIGLGILIYALSNIKY
jgi:hypothetical protein